MRCTSTTAGRLSLLGDTSNEGNSDLLCRTAFTTSVLHNILISVAKFSNDEVDKFLSELRIKRDSDYLGANVPMKCHCEKCGKEFFPRLSNLRSSKRGHECIQWNSVTPVMAQEELLSRGFQMIGEFKGLKTRTESKCITCKKISFPTISNLRQNPDQGCIYCKKILVDPIEGRKFLEDSGFNLIGVWVNASTPIEAICKKCSRSIRVRYTEIKLGHGCAKCAGKLVDEEEAVEFMKYSGYVPQVPYPGSGKKWKCVHTLCGREVSPVYGNIRSGRGGCSSCAKWGFDNSKASYVYFIHHPQFNSLKVGIANIPKLKKFDRLHRFQNQGWNPIRVLNYQIGSDARIVEREVFEVIRSELKIPGHLSKEIMKKYNGQSETFSVDFISIEEVIAIIEMVDKRHRQSKTTKVQKTKKDQTKLLIQPPK